MKKFIGLMMGEGLMYSVVLCGVLFMISIITKSATMTVVSFLSMVIGAPIMFMVLGTIGMIIYSKEEKACE